MTNSKFRIPACSVAHSALRGKYLPLPLLGNEEGILISFLITGHATFPTKSEAFSRGALFFWFVFFSARKRK